MIIAGRSAAGATSGRLHSSFRGVRIKHYDDGPAPDLLVRDTATYRALYGHLPAFCWSSWLQCLVCSQRLVVGFIRGRLQYQLGVSHCFLVTVRGAGRGGAG